MTPRIITVNQMAEAAQRAEMPQTELRTSTRSAPSLGPDGFSLQGPGLSRVLRGGREHHAAVPPQMGSRDLGRTPEALASRGPAQSPRSRAAGSLGRARTLDDLMRASFEGPSQRELDQLMEASLTSDSQEARPQRGALPGLRLTHQVRAGRGIESQLQDVSGLNREMRTGISRIQGHLSESNRLSQLARRRGLSSERRVELTRSALRHYEAALEGRSRVLEQAERAGPEYVSRVEPFAQDRSWYQIGRQALRLARRHGVSHSIGQ